MGRVFIDVSSYRRHFERRPVPTGIQRMIAMLTACSVRQLGDDNVFLSFYDTKTEKYLVADLREVKASSLQDCQHLASLIGISPYSHRLKKLRRRHSGRPIANIFHRARVKYKLLRGDRKYFEGEGIDLERLRMASRKHRAIDDVIGNNDVVLLMDAGWDVPELAGVLLHLKNRGIKIASLIHDVIPLSHPQFVSSESSERFLKWLIDATNYSTLYLTNSVSTSAHLAAFMEAAQTRVAITPIPLAQERLPAVTGADELLDKSKGGRPHTVATDAVRSLIGKPYVLFVGSRDVRKNLLRLAQAWRQLSAERPDLPMLVLAGGQGGGNERFDKFMKETANLDGMVRIIEMPSDSDLDLLYSHCLFTVFPSLFEGWGLPVGESLSYGKCVVVSETGSMPEVAGSLGVYCDPTSVDSIASASRQLLSDEAFRLSLEDEIKSTRLRSWDDVCKDLLNAIGASRQSVPIKQEAHGDRDGPVLA